MSGIVDWCATGSLTPPLCEIEQEWNGVDLDENILNFEEDLEVSSSKRRKTEGSDESSKYFLSSVQSLYRREQNLREKIKNSYCSF